MRRVRHSADIGPSQSCLCAGIFDDSRYDLPEDRASKIAAILHHHFEAAANTQAANCRRRKREDDGVFDGA